MSHSTSPTIIFIIDQYHQIFHCKPHMIFIPHERFEDNNPMVHYWGGGGGIRWVFMSVMNLQSGHQIWCQMPNLVPWEKVVRGTPYNVDFYSIHKSQ